MRRHLLVVLTLAILLPMFAVLLVAGFGLVHHQWAVEFVARSYVEDLAENVASRISRDAGPYFPTDMHRFRIFSWGPSLPGWVAVLAADGKVLMASPGVRNLAALWRPELPFGKAVEVRDKQGERYTIAVYPVDEGSRYVVAAVAWNQLLGPLVRIGHLWPILIVLMTLASLLAIWALWRWLIVPLRNMDVEISALRLGRDLPRADDPQAVLEVGRIRHALHRLATAAIERNDLRNRYVTDIVRVQEDEKRRIARELHDGPLQDITAMIQQVRLYRMPGAEEERGRHLNLVEETAQSAVRELRAMCDELSPPWLELGVAAALTGLADRLSRTFGVLVVVEADETVETTPERVLAIFRILQEAVSNAVRHGNATEITAEIGRENGGIRFTIRDNGTGFTPDLDFEHLRVRGHRGLANMMERMTLLDGTMTIESDAGRGTLLVFRFPDRPPEESGAARTEGIRKEGGPGADGGPGER